MFSFFSSHAYETSHLQVVVIVNVHIDTAFVSPNMVELGSFHTQCMNSVSFKAAIFDFTYFDGINPVSYINYMYHVGLFLMH